MATPTTKHDLDLMTAGEEEDFFDNLGKEDNGEGLGFIASFDDDFELPGDGREKDKPSAEDQTPGAGSNEEADADTVEAEAGEQSEDGSDASQETTSEGSGMILGKFKSQKDLEEAYTNLSKRLGQPLRDDDASSVQASNSSAKDEPEFKPMFVPVSQQSASVFTQEEEQKLNAIVARNIDEHYPDLPRDERGLFDWYALNDQDPALYRQVSNDWRQTEAGLRASVLEGKKFQQIEYPKVERATYTEDKKTLDEKYGLGGKALELYNEMKDLYGGNDYTPADPRFFDTKYGVAVMRPQALITYAALHRVDDLNRGLADRTKAREKAHQEKVAKGMVKPDVTVGSTNGGAKSSVTLGLPTPAQWRSKRWQDTISDKQYDKYEAAILKLPPEKQEAYFAIETDI